MGEIQEYYAQYLNERYEELAILNNNDKYKTILVRQRNGGKILVKKELSMAQVGVYQQLKSIQHPNLVEVFDVYYNEKGCVVLEDYVSGRNLQEVLEEKGKLTNEETMGYLLQILEGLKEIHSFHIIHRDLKPENILISTDGIVKLLDFGIARFQKENQAKDTTILGTVGYASPEQFGFQQTDVRTDIYAVGILLNKMLTGKMPHEEVAEDEKIRKIIARCTEIDPKNRYESVEALKQELWGSTRDKLEIFGRKTTRDGNKIAAIVSEPVESEMVELQWIPGFRTGVGWKKRLACMGYVFFLLSMVIFTSEVISGGIGAVILEMLAMLMYMWLPVAIGGNLFRWDRKVPGIRRLPRELRIILRVIVCFILIYTGLLLDSYVNYTLVGLPKPD